MSSSSAASSKDGASKDASPSFHLSALSSGPSRPVSMFVLGATGRTGIPFLHAALARGHKVTALLRDRSKLPPELLSSPLLTTVEGQLSEQPKYEAALTANPPEVVVSMLASDPKPHTALSTGTRTLLDALRAIKAKQQGSQAGALALPLPHLTISAWGFGATAPYLDHRWQDRLTRCVGGWIFSNILPDFKLQEELLIAGMKDGLVKPTYLHPPFLTNGKPTGTAEWGEAVAFEHRMSSLDTVSRLDMANVLITLAEEAAIDAKQHPEHIALRQP